MKATPSNTIRPNEKAANAFRQYLLEKEEESTDFERFSAEDLNRLLQRYYFEARTVNGELYKTSSLENFRHSLNRYLMSEPNNKIATPCLIT